MHYNYTSFRTFGQQAYQFVDKIRMLLAAGGASVAAKRRAVEPANKVKILP
jgi:hypothetical protein